MDFYARALALRQQTVDDRRYMHTHAEVGLDIPVTKAYVMEPAATTTTRPCS